MLRIGVLISGRGSNLQSIIDHIEEGKLEAEIAVVVSNVATAPGLERAKRHEIPSLFLDPDRFSKKMAYEEALVRELKQAEVSLVCLAGYMKLVGKPLLTAFPQAMMNIHPSLLPAFPGLHPHRDALAYGVRVSGCTVHFVDEGVDSGPIILQTAVPVHEGDTEETLAARILKEEHKLYPRAIELFSQGRLTVRGRHVQLA